MTTDIATVYRVEDGSGSGPYAVLGYDGVHGVNWDREAHGRLHPTPARTFLYELQGKGLTPRFGFSSRRQLQRWFSRTDLENLKAKGFDVVRHRVPRALVYKQRCQVVFCNPIREDTHVPVPAI